MAITIEFEDDTRNIQYLSKEEVTKALHEIKKWKYTNAVMTLEGTVYKFEVDEIIPLDYGVEEKNMFVDNQYKPWKSHYCNYKVVGHLTNCILIGGVHKEVQVTVSHRDKVMTETNAKITRQAISDLASKIMTGVGSL